MSIKDSDESLNINHLIIELQDIKDHIDNDSSLDNDDYIVLYDKALSIKNEIEAINDKMSEKIESIEKNTNDDVMQINYMILENYLICRNAILTF